MGTAVRDFLELDKDATAEMGIEDLRSEVDGWRTVFSLLPREVLEMMARLHDVVRFTKRNYTSSVGVLLSFKMEPTEYSIGVRETAFDSLRGVRIVEDKVLVIPEAALMFREFISDTQDADPEQEEAVLAQQTLG